MLPWEIDAVVNVVLVAIAFWVRPRPNARRNLRWLAFVYGALLVASSCVGIAGGLLLFLDPFAGELADASQRARAAMGISEPVNCALTGVMAFLLPSIAALTMFRCSRDESPGSVAR